MNHVAKVHEIALQPTTLNCPGPKLELLRDTYTEAAATRRKPSARSLSRLVTQSGGLNLPRVVLQYDLSDAVQAGRAEPRDFLLGDRNLGKSFVAYVGPFRPHALRLIDRHIDAESFDPTSPVFCGIALEAQQRRRSAERSARVGAEFLLWLPRARRLALFEFSNRATRNAMTAHQRISGLALFTTESVGTGSWFMPVCQDAPPGRYRVIPRRRWAAALEVFATHRPEVPAPQARRWGPVGCVAVGDPCPSSTPPPVA